MEGEGSVEYKEKLEPAKRWHSEIELSLKRDKYYLRDGKKIIERYRNESRIAQANNESERKADHFNILWANTEVMRPAVYSRTPRPDIRRRFQTPSPDAPYVVELLERAASYTFEASNLDDHMVYAVNDMLLPGRGTVRVRYVPHFSEGEMGEEVLDYEEVTYEGWNWEDIILGPGKTWEELPWVAFTHMLSKPEVEELAPEFADVLTYGGERPDEESKKDRDNEASIEKKAKIYEVWDRETKTVKWLAEEYKDSLIREDEDPLGLKDFWPIPRPLYAIESNSSLVPVADFTQYRHLADELEDCTVRMGRIVRALRVRGVYNSTISEMAKLFDAGDNDMIPAEGLSRLVESGGVERNIWMFPNDVLVGVLRELQQYRAQLIQQIYELTGISDILRGNSNPHETLGAQKIKANFGSQRLSRKQKEVQRYARDLLRLTVELIAERFSPETLEKMTGLKFLREMQKQQIQQQMQQAQMMAQQTGQQPQQPPPEMMELMQKPSWETIQQTMQDDLLRAYAVDIETDSTIEADQQADQEALSTLMQAISQFGHGVAPLLESGAMNQDAAKQLLVSMLRRFRLGREVEEAIRKAPPQDPNQAENQQQQMEMQQKQQEMQFEQQKMQMEIEQAKQEAQMQQREHALEVERMQLERVRDQEKHRAEMEKMAMDLKVAREKTQLDMRRINAADQA